MTTDEAIKILDPKTTAEALTEIEYYGGFSGQKAAVKAVEDACLLGVAALERSRWVPCSERLPNPGERVLTTDGAFVGEMYINKRGQWQRYNVANHETLMALDILAWMPLPEPPKEGGTQNGAALDEG